MSVEKLSQNQKDGIKNLLEWLSDSIKTAEQNLENTPVDTEMDKLVAKVANLETQSQADNLLEDVKLQLWALKEYNQYKELSLQLQDKVSDFEKMTTQNFQKQLGDLKKELVKKPLNPHTANKKEIIEAAELGRTADELEITSVVDSLILKGWWLWKLAQKANWQKS